MNYLDWRDDIFGKPPDADPVTVGLLRETYDLSHEENLDHIDRALGDAEIHGKYSRDQIGIGLQLIYSNNCSDIVFAYIEAGDEARRVRAIRQLDLLYRNYFDRYCIAPVHGIDEDRKDGRLGFLCYMLWDIFVVSPNSASPAMIDAALDVMENAIWMRNENCIESATHGLGHWALFLEEGRPKSILTEWLCQPTSFNPHLLDYAEQATTGVIL